MTSRPHPGVSGRELRCDERDEADRLNPRCGERSQVELAARALWLDHMRSD